MNENTTAVHRAPVCATCGRTVVRLVTVETLAGPVGSAAAMYVHASVSAWAAEPHMVDLSPGVAA